MNWGDPDKLRWIWIVLGFVLLSFLAEGTKAGKLRRFADKARLGSMVLSLSYFRRFLKLVCLFSALSLMVVAAAQPRSQGERVLVRNTGVDIVIAVDVSQSMLAEDIRPNRLEKAKLELQDLVEIAKGDRIGVVAFAGDAFIQVPLTLDRSAVKLFLRALSPNQIPVPGTVLTRALEVSASMFPKPKADLTEEEKKNEPGKVIILLTDGEDRETKPIEMAKKIAEAGIAVYTIGIGTSEGEAIPVKIPGQMGTQFKKDMFGKVVVTKLDEQTLREIAKITGGEYFHSSGGFLEVGKIYRSIQNLSERETGEGWVIQYEPHYQMPILLAIIFLLLQMVISEQKNHKAPKKRKQAFGLLLLLACLPALVGFEQVSVNKNEEANSLFRKKKYEEAKALYSEVIQFESRVPKVEYNLSNVDYQTQDYKKAAAGYQKVAKTASNDRELAAKANYNLGNALYRLEDNKKAIEAYKNALRNDPKDFNAKFNLELLMQEEQQQNQNQDQDDKQQDQQQNQDQNQENQDKNQDQNNQDQNDQDNQDQNKDQQNQDQNKDQQDQNKDQNKDQNDQNQDQNQDKQDGGQNQDQNQGGQSQSDQKDKDQKDQGEGGQSDQSDQEQQDKDDQQEGESSGQNGGNEEQDSGQKDKQDQGEGSGEQQDDKQNDQGDQKENNEGKGEQESPEGEGQKDPQDKQGEGDQPDQKNQGEGQDQPQDQGEQPQDQGEQPQGQGEQPQDQSQGDEQQDQQPQGGGQEPGENEGQAPAPQPLSGRFESILGALSDDEGQLVSVINAKPRPQQVSRRQDW